MEKKCKTCFRPVLLDEQDFERFKDKVFSCNDNGKGPVRVYLAGRPVSIASLITGCLDTDHINRDGHDNRRVNLREATRSQQGINRDVPINQSGFRGVTRHHHQWAASIKVNGKAKWLGSFPTREAAATAYNKAAKEIFGDFAVLNNI